MEAVTQTSAEDMVVANGEMEPKKNIAPHPWRRYFARMLDLFIYVVIWTFFQLLILRWNLTAHPFLDTLVGSYISCGFMILFEPILLATLGTTPGKWILGLVVRDSYGKKLTYSAGLARVLELFVKGLGFNLPIYSIVRLVISYGNCKKGEIMWWDDGITYEIKGNLTVRTIGFVASHIVLSLIALLMAFQAYLPANRGDLTAKEFYENCNQQIKFIGIEYGKTLGDDGRWKEKNENSYIEFFGGALPNYELTLEDGVVKGVTIEVEGKDAYLIPQESNAAIIIGVLSFVGAQKEINCINLQTSGVLKQLRKSCEDYEMEVAGVKITNRVEYRGYELYDNGDDVFLFPIEGEEQYFKNTFVMEKK